MTTYNWKTPVRSLLRTCKKHGLTPVSVDNGDGWVETATTAQAVAEIVATDESRVAVFTPCGRRAILLLVLGNEPSELLADYTALEVIDAAAIEHYNNWEGKPCPTTES
jgi:hypothetical protein